MGEEFVVSLEDAVSVVSDEASASRSLKLNTSPFCHTMTRGCTSVISFTRNSLASNLYKDRSTTRVSNDTNAVVSSGS